MSTALSFYDGYRSARVAANLIQGQRDYFGAHTVKKISFFFFGSVIFFFFYKIFFMMFLFIN